MYLQTFLVVIEKPLKLNFSFFFYFKNLYYPNCCYLEKKHYKSINSLLCSELNKILINYFLATYILKYMLKFKFELIR